MTVLRREGAGPSKAIRRLRLGLVMAQMASCCVLVISTAVLLEGLRAAKLTSAGHRLGRTFLASVQAEPSTGIRYFQHVEEATKSIAGVSGIAWAGQLPGGQPTWQSFRIEPPQLPLREVWLDIGWFTADSLSLFPLPPKAGRMFGFAEQTCRAVIVNEEAARELFDGRTAGRVIQDSAGLPVEIIGVVPIRKPGQATRNRPTIYYDHTNQKGPPPGRITHALFRTPIVSELARAELDANVVSPGYFDAMGLKLIAGQGFTDPIVSSQCRVGIVNREAADLYFGGKAVGAAVIDDQGRRTGIVGVAHSVPLGNFQRRVEPAIYLPMSQDALPRMTMIVHARDGNGGPTLADLRSRIESVPGNGPAPLLIKTFDTHLTQTSLAPLHIAATIFGASATMALLLSVLGLFGALSDIARQRRRELAVRIALGAQRWRVVNQVLGEGGRLACAGALAGTLGSLLLLRWLTGIIPGSGSPTLWVWLAAPVLLAGAVAIASFLPARRALMVNPLMIMRDDN